MNCLVEVMPNNFAAWVADVREYTRRPQEYVVFKMAARIQGDVVLDLDVAADDRIAGDMHVLAQNATLADFCICHHMAEVPDLGPGPDVARFIDKCRRVCEIVLAHFGLSSRNRGSKLDRMVGEKAAGVVD